MISHASHASVWCLVGDSSMCWDTALDKAFENVFCILAILRFQTKNRFCESSQRLIQPRLVRCPPPQTRPSATAAATYYHARKDRSPPSQRRVVETFAMPALILFTFLAELGKLGGREGNDFFWRGDARQRL